MNYSDVEDELVRFELEDMFLKKKKDRLLYCN